MTGELHDLRPTRVGASDAQREMRRLGAGHREPCQLAARDEPVDELRPTHLELVARAHVRASRHLLLHGLHDGRVTVAEEQRAVPHPVVDVLVPVDVPLARAARALHVDGERAQMSDVVRDAARNGATRAVGEHGRVRMRGAEAFDDGHTRSLVSESRCGTPDDTARLLRLRRFSTGGARTDRAPSPAADTPRVSGRRRGTARRRRRARPPTDRRPSARARA
jgi:hypothetical protein